MLCGRSIGYAFAALMLSGCVAGEAPIAEPSGPSCDDPIVDFDEEFSGGVCAPEGEAVDRLGEPCDTEGSANPCLPYREGVQYCHRRAPEVEELVWAECGPPDAAECVLGEEDTVEACLDEEDCVTCPVPCILVDGVPQWEDVFCDTPLVLSFDGASVQMQPAPAATFDISDAGGCNTTDWPAAVTPWLALDRDGDGAIESGRELFGSGTRLESGRRASNGFVALTELDDNSDGRIDPTDGAFADLVLWSDEDTDKRSTWFELQPLSSRGILSIELDYGIDRQCDDRGNCAVERASFTFIDRGGEIRDGEVVDMHLSCQ